MARPPATINRNNGSLLNELAPFNLIDPRDLAIIDMGAKAWWPGEAEGMEGVRDGSTRPLRWRSLASDRQSLKPSVAAVPPGYGYDPTIGKSFLRFGYDGGRSRRTLSLATGRLVTAGTGYVNGEVITLQNGVKVRNDTTAAGPVGAFTIVDFGVFTSQPSSVLTQVSTTGAGTGFTFLPEMKATTCGAMELSPLPDIIPALPFSIVTAFRCPLVSEVPDSGGVIIGAQLGEAEIFQSNANTRWYGLKVGGGSSYEPGRLMAHWQGDLTNQFNGALGYDYRDAQWHVGIQTFKGGATGDSGTLWVDNHKEASVTGFNALSTVDGAKKLRLGAAGLPASGPCGGFAGDIGEVLIVPLDLNADAAARATIMNRMLPIWRPS